MSGLVGWFARNSVAANLLLLMLVFGGVLSIQFTLRTESFPEITPENIIIRVLYPGATPEEVEESICIKIEEAVEGVDGVDRIVSRASENLGTVSIEIVDGESIRDVLDDVKNEIDAIDTFPEEAEEPTIDSQRVEEHVIAITISGDTSERNLKVVAEELRDELLVLPGVSKAEIEGARATEIAIEVQERELRRHRLSFSDVAAAVRRHSLNLPAGSVKTDGGEILFRSDSQAYGRREFERIPVISLPDGAQVYVEDVAKVTIGFEETDLASRLDGKPALFLQAYRRGNENTPVVAATVRDFIETARARIPAGIELGIWRDQSKDLDDRMILLRQNGLQGLALVFMVLALFLKARLAFWVAVGLTSAILGTVWLLPWLDISLNFLSSFGFILVLGILVDDAIIVGENIEAHRGMGKKPGRAAIDGAREVMVPVVLAILTTAIAFSPMLRLPGRTGDFTATIAVTVIVAIGLSLVESLLILPNHLGHESRRHGGLLAKLASWTGGVFAPVTRVWDAVQSRFARTLQWVIDRLYKPTLEKVIVWRYFTAAAGIAFIVFTGGLIAGGWLKVTFFPGIEGNDVLAVVRLPEGTSVARTEEATAILTEAAEAVREELEGGAPGSLIKQIRTTIGDQPGNRTTGPPDQRLGFVQSRGNLAEVHMELVSSELRDIRGSTIARAWMDEVGDSISDVEELLFKSDQINSGAPVNVELSGRNVEELVAAADELKEHLKTFPGTYNIADDFRQGKREMALEVLPSGSALGLTQQDVASQVRQGFYGDEVQRVQLGSEDVKVFVRYPPEERESLADLESLRIRLPDRSEVPFFSVATTHMGRGPADINRVNRQRTVVVTSDLDRAIGNANDIAEKLTTSFFPELKQRYPSLRIEFGGEQSRQAESFASLFSGMALAVFVMFTLLAVVFRSYLQPLIVLSAVPFGVAGAIWGHFLLGMNLTFLSMIGVLALMGVVVNDSLVLIDFINRFRRDHGQDLLTAIRAAGPRRFRPIILTSMTTVAGLTPILFETSAQALFVIPMAVTLAFGVALATLCILVIVPASYLIIEDVRRLLTGKSERDLVAIEGADDPATEDVNV